MTPEERQVITGIFGRLRAAESHPRDPEAERLINDLVAQQPYAPYAMAQSIYVHEQALDNLGKRVADLERQLSEAREKSQSGGFLSGLFGGQGAERKLDPHDESAGSGRWAPSPGTGGPAAYQAYASSPQGYPPSPQGYPATPGSPPQQGPWGVQPRGGGFLHGAMTTAAGVAGGMVLANVLTSAFSHTGGLGSFGSGLGTASALGAPTPSTQGIGAFGSDLAGRQDSVAADSAGFSNLADQSMLRNASYGDAGTGAADHGGVQTSGGGDDLDDDRNGIDQNWGEGADDGTFDDNGSLDDDLGFSGDV